jgi:cell division protein FtsW
VLAGSLGFVVALQMVLHIAVDTISIPPTGMSFPFVSAGGTGLMIMAAAVAIIISVSAHGAGGNEQMLSRSPRPRMANV